MLGALVVFIWHWSPGAFLEGCWFSFHAGRWRKLGSHIGEGRWQHPQQQWEWGRQDRLQSGKMNWQVDKKHSSLLLHRAIWLPSEGVTHIQITWLRKPLSRVPTSLSLRWVQIWSRWWPRGAIAVQQCVSMPSPERMNVGPEKHIRCLPPLLSHCLETGSLPGLRV